MTQKATAATIIGTAVLITTLIVGNVALKKTPQELVISETPSPTPTPKVAPQVWGESTYQVTKPTPEPIEPVVTTSDPDPVVVCKSDRCGSKNIRQSECNESVCCQIGNDWYFYPSDTDCKQAQDAYWERHFSDSPTTLPLPTVEPFLGVTLPPAPTPTSTPSVGWYFCSWSQYNWCQLHISEHGLSEYEEKCDTSKDSFWCPHFGKQINASDVKGLEYLDPNTCICVK